MNSSPLCNISLVTDPMKMAMDIKSLYAAENMPQYVESLHSPERRNYVTEQMMKDEIFLDLTKVR